MKVSGGCYCGDIRYHSNGAVQAAIQCHCRECQYITGGNPNVFLVVPLDGFKFTQGHPEIFKRPDLKDPVSRFFCKNCGTAIGTQSPRRKDSMILKVGTLDNPSLFKAEIAIFTVDSQPFHHIPNDIPSYKHRP